MRFRNVDGRPTVPTDGGSADEAVPIWTPDPDRVADATITRFAAEVSRRTGRELGSYPDLWAWSVEHLEDFWATVWDFFDIAADGNRDTVLAERTMPGARWFPGTRLNYAEHALRSGALPGRADAVAVTAIGEDGATTTTTWAELGAQVAAFAGWLRERGVRPGDRVVGYLPNSTPTLVAFLASASIGAVWAACGQDYSAEGAAARFAQLDPWCSSPPTATAGTAASSTGAARWRRWSGRCPRCASPSAWPTSAWTPRRDPERRSLGGGHRHPGRAAGSSGCRSTRRCGCCSPRARPGGRRASCTATAGCCSSTASCSACTWT